MTDEILNDVGDLKTRIREVEKSIGDIVHKITQINRELIKVDDRTIKLEQISHELDNIVTAHKLQINEMAFAISQLHTSIKSLDETKVMVEKTRQDLSDTISSIKSLERSLIELSKLPEKINNLTIETRTMKPVVDAIAKLGWIFATAIIALAANLIFGGNNPLSGG